MKNAAKEAKEAFVLAMQRLMAGDVITNLNCDQCRDMKVLVLDEDAGLTGGVHFSIMSPEICIMQDSHGPFRWDFETQRIVTKDGEIYDHISPGVKVLKGEGVKELALYRRLPELKKRQLNITEEEFDRLLKDEPNVPMTLAALVGDEELSSLAAIEACVNYAFGNRPVPISRREILLLTMAVRYLAIASVMNTNAGVIAVREESPMALFLGDSDPLGRILQ